MTEGKRPPVTINGVSECDPEKTAYVLTADITDKDGETNNQVILQFSALLMDNDTSPLDRASRHVDNIQFLLNQSGQGETLSNIKLMNFTIEEAENKGFLPKPDILIVE